MIQFKTEDSYRFKIDNASYAKGSVIPEYHADGVQVRFLYQGAPIYEFQEYGTYVDGDNADAPFASMLELRIYVDQVFNLVLPNAKPFRHLSAATTNETSVKPGIALLHSMNVIHRGTTASYLKIYDTASAPDIGTDVPVITILLPGKPIIGYVEEGAEAQFGQPISIECIPKTLHFYYGLAFAITGAYGDDDETAIGAGDVILNLIYQ